MHFILFMFNYRFLFFSEYLSIGAYPAKQLPVRQISLRAVVIFLLVFNHLFGTAQATFPVSDPYQQFFEARQWFTEGNYGLSYPVFKELERKMANGELQQRQLQYDEVRFYTIACELMQGNIAAERHASEYLKGNNTPVYKAGLGYYTGIYYFDKEQFDKAAESFSKTSPDVLSAEHKNRMQFAYGYSLLTQRRFKEAKPLLNEARLQAGSGNFIDANYYYGLLAYNDGEYNEAIRCFEIAGNAPVYQPLAPYYSASIQYALGNKEKGLELAEKALQQGNQFYEKELNQLAGHAYFEKGDYGRALPFLENYVNAATKVKREDLYELACCYYHQKNWKKAIEMFRPLSDGKDSLSQHAMYLLGDAYLKTNDKANAKTAFRFCAANTSNPVIREYSMFNDGKLSHDLGFDGEATQILKKFLNEYPKSENAAEARDLLVASLSNTSNYKEALALYEALPNKGPAGQRIYPKLLYNRAQEELNDRRIDEAEKLLDKAIAAPNNEDVLPLAKFWKGELAFFKKEYEQAVRYMKDYLERPVVSGEANSANAKYTIAYCQLLTGQYGAAENGFEDLLNAKEFTPAQKEDVKMRYADACFMQKNFGRAKPLYNEATERKTDFADYALYQLGMIAGAENKPQQKITLLQSVDKSYPSSLLAPMANLEIANTYLGDEKYRDALPWLAKVLAAKGGENLKPEALLKQGLAFYNLDNSTEALNSFKLLLTRYGDSPEAEEAIDNVRSIFIEQGKPNEFIAFMKGSGRDLDKSTADSLSFVAAEIQLSEGKKEQALKGLLQYLDDYPDGRYLVQANWYTAELYRDRKDLKSAIPFYEKLVKLAPNKHAEAAMLQSARYYYFEQKNFSRAIEFYNALAENASSQDNKVEAMRGLVRCHYYTGAYEAATRYANDLLLQRGIGTDDKIFSNLVLGKNAQQQSNFNDAIKYYKEVANLNKAEYGAEARYGMAECLFNQGKYADAENAAFETIKKSGSYVMWVTKSYLLLGDIYYRQKDYFNAKATYKSVAENAQIEALKEEAAKKLAIVEKEEKEQSKISQ
jgi:tetratricopeptide (TPR) repeat protein